MLVEHHKKYKEIHGVDETVWMERGDHYTLHNQLRKEGKCKVPFKQLKTISNAACGRTVKIKEWKKKYMKNNIQRIDFHETVMENIRLRETLQYNNKTGVVSWMSRFQGTNGKETIEVNI